MGKVIAILLGIGLIVVLYLGHSHWNELLTASAKEKPIVEQKAGSKQTETEVEVDSVDYNSYMKNWPKGAEDQFQKKLAEKTPFKIVFAGSTAIGTETTGAYPLVKQKLLETFGEDHLQVELMTFPMTSAKLINEGKQAGLASTYADLIVLEPFILANNGVVSTNNTIKDLTTIMDDVHAVKPETAFIIQPSYPLYQAKNYPVQVAQLKKFATDNDFTYLDHWTAWPDSNSVEFKDYVTPDQSAPSEKGIQVWSDALIQFLVSQ